MPPPIYKICILGLSGTGKSSMCSQFAIRHFDGVRYFPTNKTQTHFGRIWVAEQAKKRKLEAMLDLEDTVQCMGRARRGRICSYCNQYHTE